MSKAAKEKIEEQRASDCDVPEVAKRAAAICNTDSRVLEESVRKWAEAGFFTYEGGRRLNAAQRLSADVFVAACLARLLQVGVSDNQLIPIAVVCGNVVSAEKVERDDLWVLFSSGSQPVVVTQRFRMIDAVARAKGRAVTVLDMAALLTASGVTG